MCIKAQLWSFLGDGEHALLRSGEEGGRVQVLGLTLSCNTDLCH